MMTRVFVTFFLVLAGRSFGESVKKCKTIRLDKGSGAFAHLPFYHQSKYGYNPGICWAIEGALLIDYYRANEEGGRLRAFTSPISLAEAARRNPKSSSLPVNDPTAVKPFYSGNVREAIEAGLENPVCDAKWLNRFDGLIDDDIGPKFRPERVEDADILDFFKSIRDYKETAAALERNTCPYTAYLCGRIAKNPTMAGDIIKAMKQLTDSDNLVTRISKFVRSICTEHQFKIRVPKPLNTDLARLSPDGSIITGLETADRIETFIHRSLDIGVPVGVGYCGSFLRRNSPKVRPGSESKEAITPISFEDCWPDGGIVVGQQFNEGTNTCEFAVRTSYGQNCTSNIDDLLSKYQCDNGNIMIPAEELSQYALDETWIPKPK